MNYKPNVLVVCGKNKKRSRTAEYIFKNDSRFNIRSAGLSPKSNKQISEKDILWADLIFVMNYGQGARIKSAYQDIDSLSIEVLDIDDDFAYLDSELIALLKERINNTLKVAYKI